MIFPCRHGSWIPNPFPLPATQTSIADRFGKFTGDGREYRVTQPFTPRPWHNYFFNNEYLVNLTHFGTGASFRQSTGEGLHCNITEDPDGNGGPRFLYLRDNDNGRYWTPTGAGSTRKPAGRRCDIGLG